MRKLPGSFTMRRDGVLPRGDWFQIENKESETPKVYIYDEIGFWGTEASAFVKELNEIKGSKMELHLNSPGGEVFDGLAIYNALRQHKAKVSVYVDGLAASAASFIAQAGDEVIMARNAQLMIHDGIAFAYGNEQDMLDTAAILSQISNNIADIYAFHAKERGGENTMEDFRDLMRAEVWYTGKEAVTAGLADTVLDHDDEEAEEAKNKWDLSFYNHAGREKAESPLRVQEKIRLANRLKESSMPKGTTDPKATVDPEATPAPPPDDTPPAEPTGDPEQPGTEAQPQDGALDSETPGQQPAATPPENPAPANKAQGVMIDGKMVTDWSIINSHMQALQSAQAEQTATFRKGFVEQLAADNKIGATQVDSLVALVNGDDKVPAMSDEQFAAFQASYESSAPSSLFESHAVTGGQESAIPGAPTQMSADERTNRIGVLEGIVSMHRRTMPEDKVKNTKSYLELQTLLGNTDKS